MSKTIAISLTALLAAAAVAAVVHQAPDLWKYLRAEGM
jgi:hypothetical protein